MAQVVGCLPSKQEAPQTLPRQWTSIWGSQCTEFAFYCFGKSSLWCPISATSTERAPMNILCGQNHITKSQRLQMFTLWWEMVMGTPPIKAHKVLRMLSNWKISLNRAKRQGGVERRWDPLIFALLVDQQGQGPGLSQWHQTPESLRGAMGWMVALPPPKFPCERDLVSK
jgi:hypothetical protein